MNEVLETALANMINKAVENIGTATDFLLEEVPVVIQQLITWKLLEVAISTFFCLFIIALTATAILKLLKTLKVARDECIENKQDNQHYEWNNTRKLAELRDWGILLMLGTIVCFVISMVSLVVLFNNIKLVAYIWVAPKVWLLEYGSALVR